ncbi:MAG TPA: phenylalanine--tRNA ligase subunit beta [Alphaproteobacteria bacterium]|nr:phenylalanine--tRNA ligase subunit beta [Alphaproteobacteria bacterium]HAJ45936.1 phenylalanine--tRNA ligase subunit beta [Alphaproteobacteria bacterium]
MKFTLSWLKDHLETTATADEIAQKLTAIGLEVESVDDAAKALAPFTIAYVKSAEKHPNADKLRVCMVDTGTETLQVVCGAPNARAGMYAVFAKPGTLIPASGITIQKSKIRDVESNGMLCSERELGLGEDHNGIIDLPGTPQLGMSFAKHMSLDDAVIDINITPNRGDCLGVAGVARDLAAAGLGTIKTKAPSAPAGTFPNPVQISLHFAPRTENACPVFAGATVRGVKNGPSPAWLQQRLKAIGLRPISALVDITNYISFDRGRPLHVYDADKLKGEIHARLARQGEKLAALDGKTYDTDPEMCVIADDSGVLGFGGVMGGEATGCTETTTTVFIESAYFDPVRTARTGRIANINSDARYRFERGVDPNFVTGGLELAIQMILELCGGTVSERTVVGTPPQIGATVENFDPGHVRRLTGIEIADAEALDILRKLGFAISASQVKAPSWRPDIKGSADLVEEVTRIVGLDRIPSTPLPRLAAVTRPVMTAQQKRVRAARRTLAARGFAEAMTWSFVSKAHAEQFGHGNERLELANPISADLDVMRPSVLPGLLSAAARNAARGLHDSLLFEIGPQFDGPEPGEQALVAAALRSGEGPRHWAKQPWESSVFAAKADALAVLEAAGAPVDSLQITADAPGWYHPGRSGALKLGPKTVLAYFGELHPKTLMALDVKGPVAASEVFLSALPEAKARPTKAKPKLGLSPFQPVERDFAFLLKSSVPASEAAKAAQGADKALITAVRIFDVYEGKGIEPGHKSLALSVRMEPKDKTMTDVDIDAVSQKIVAAVTKATGAVLRG